MLQAFKYSFFSLIRDKEQLFWALAFPIILGTFFHFAFGNLTGATAPFSEIPVAVVITEDNQRTDLFKEMTETLSSGENALLTPEYVKMAEAKKLLEAEDVRGIFEVGSDIHLTVTQQGITQSILQSISEEFIRRESTITTIATERPEMLEQALTDMNQNLQVNQEITLGSGETNMLVYYFYVLLAMVCFMGSSLGFSKAIAIQPGLSPIAARRAVSPSKKFTLIASDFFASVAVQFLLVVGSILYFMLVLRVPFGNQLGIILLTCFVGCLTGVSFGIFMATVLKGKEKVRESIMTGFTFLLYFLGGLFTIDVRLAVRRNFPIIDRFNPIALIADSFQSSTIYDTYEHYFQTLLTLLFFTIFFCVVSAVVLRRKRYANL